MTFRMNHGDAIRRTFALTAFALTFAAAFGLAGVFVEAQAATQSQCINAFSDSDASDTCELDSASASGSNCTLGGLCQSGSEWVSVSITVSYDDVDDLQNCSGSLATSC